MFSGWEFELRGEFFALKWASRARICVLGEPECPETVLHIKVYQVVFINKCGNYFRHTFMLLNLYLFASWLQMAQQILLMVILALLSLLLCFIEGDLLLLRWWVVLWYDLILLAQVFGVVLTETNDDCLMACSRSCLSTLPSNDQWAKKGNTELFLFILLNSCYGYMLCLTLELFISFCIVLQSASLHMGSINVPGNGIKSGLVLQYSSFLDYFCAAVESMPAELYSGMLC